MGILGSGVFGGVGFFGVFEELDLECVCKVRGFMEVKFRIYGSLVVLKVVV